MAATHAQTAQREARIAEAHARAAAAAHSRGDTADAHAHAILADLAADRAGAAAARSRAPRRAGANDADIAASDAAYAAEMIMDIIAAARPNRAIGDDGQTYDRTD